MGTVSQMRLWNMSRSASQIVQDMRGPVRSDSPGLLMDYRFKEGPEAMTIQDASLYGNHGQLSIRSGYAMFNFPPRIPAIGFASTQSSRLVSMTVMVGWPRRASRWMFPHHRANHSRSGVCR